MVPQRSIPVLAALSILAACGTNRPATTTDTSSLSYRNPIWDHDFPDPNLVQAPDGYFYAYATNSNWREDGLGGPYTLPVLRSTDLIHWSFVRDALPVKPAWKKDGGGIWAPDVTYHGGGYLMYYSYSYWDDPNPGIGVAVSDRPEGPFTDRGKLFSSKEIGVPNSIDPFLLVDKGKLYLFWGSFHGIYGILLSADGTSIQGEKFRIADNRFEGSYIYRRGKFYYYFGSTGTCCDGGRSTYHVLVGRATQLSGPYLDKDGRDLLRGGGTLLLEGNPGDSGFVGTGHNGDIVTDDAGQTWMVYHAIAKQHPGHRNGKGTRRPMLMDRIEWHDGWPVIRGRQPSLSSGAGPVWK